MKQSFLYSSLFFLLVNIHSLLFSQEMQAERQRTSSEADRVATAAMLQTIKNEAQKAKSTEEITSTFKVALTQDQKEWNSIFSYVIDPNRKTRALKKLKILATLLLPKVREILDHSIIEEFVNQFTKFFGRKEAITEEDGEIRIVLNELEKRYEEIVIPSWRMDVETVLNRESKEWLSIFSDTFNRYPSTIKMAALKILAQALLPKIQNFTDIISLQLFIEKYAEALGPKSSFNREQVTYQALEALQKKEDEFKKQRANEMSGSLGRKLGRALNEAAQDEQKAEPSAPPMETSSQQTQDRAEEARLKAEAEQKAKAEAEEADRKVKQAEEAGLKAEAEQKAKLEDERQAKEAEETKTVPPVDAQLSNLKPRAQSAPPPVPAHDADYEALAAKLTRPPVRTTSLKEISHSAPPSQDPAGQSIGLKSPAKPAAQGELDTPDQSPARQSAGFKAELEQKAKLEADRKAAEEARIKAVAEQKAKREVGRKAKEAEEARSKAENERKAKAEEEARLAAIKAKQEEERMAQEAKATEEARIKAENERKTKAAEEARIEAKLEEERMAQEAKAAEEARLKAENERKTKEAEEARSKDSGPQPASTKVQAKLAALPLQDTPEPAQPQNAVPQSQGAPQADTEPIQRPQATVSSKPAAVANETTTLNQIAANLLLLNQRLDPVCRFVEKEEANDLLKDAEAHYQRREHVRARELFDQVAQQKADPNAKATAERRLRDLKREENYDELKSSLTASKADLHGGSLEQSIPTLETIAKQNRWRDLQSEACMCLANEYYKEKATEKKAREFYKIAAQIGECPASQMRAYERLGYIAYQEGATYEAYEHFYNILEICGEPALSDLESQHIAFDKHVYIRILTWLGVLNCKDGKFARAKDLLEKVLSATTIQNGKVAQDEQDREAVAMAQAYLGKMLANENERWYSFSRAKVLLDAAAKQTNSNEAQQVAQLADAYHRCSVM